MDEWPNGWWILPGVVIGAVIIGWVISTFVF